MRGVDPVACSSSVARAASSAFAGSPGRARRARSRLATTHLARATPLSDEGTRSTSQEGLRSNEIAELRHRDASKREAVASSRRATASMRRGIARRECRAAAAISESIESVTLVTPILRYLR